VAGQVIAGELIAVAQASEDALELVVREHARLVYRIAYSALRNHHDAEDVTQETFVRVLRWRKKLDSVRDLKAWLARIAWRIAIDRVRKKSTVPLNDVEEGGDYAKTSSGDAEQVPAVG
jgi:RNA polymerase sigma factor (sigma-70 family)